MRLFENDKLFDKVTDVAVGIAFVLTIGVVAITLHILNGGTI